MSNGNPCDTLPGRLRDICRGHDDDGKPVLTLTERVAYIERWKSQGRLPRDFRPGDVCRHFGEQISSIGCQTCGGTVELKIFRCGIHEECTPRRNKEGIMPCEGCADYGRQIGLTRQ